MWEHKEKIISNVEDESEETLREERKERWVIKIKYSTKKVKCECLPHPPRVLPEMNIRVLAPTAPDRR